MARLRVSKKAGYLDEEGGHGDPVAGLDAEFAIDLGSKDDGEGEAEGVEEGDAGGEGGEGLGQVVEAAEEFVPAVVEGGVDRAGEDEEIFLELGQEP